MTVYGLVDEKSAYIEYGEFDSSMNFNQKMRNKLKHKNGTGVNLSKAVDNIAKNSINKKIYCFMFFDSHNSDFQKSANDSRATLYGVKHGNLKMDISVVSNIPDDKKGTADESQKTYAAALFEMTNGIEMTRDNFVNEALIHIYGEIPNISTTYSMGVFATNWREVKLEAPITEKYLDLSERDISELDESDLEGCADTDRDGLYDFQEIRFTYNGYSMRFNEDGTPELWSLDALRELNVFNDMPTYGYVEKFVKKSKKRILKNIMSF